MKKPVNKVDNILEDLMEKIKKEVYLAFYGLISEHATQLAKFTKFIVKPPEQKK